MTYYDYTIAIASFVSDLATKAIAEGWHQQEAGYNTIYPDGYPGFLVLFESRYDASLIAGDGGNSSYAFTQIVVHCRATYNAATHVPTTNANGGDGRFRTCYGSDQSASATKTYRVRGWIDSKHICIDVMMDNTVTNWSRWLIYVGEVEAVDAGANTCMCLCPEVINQVGGGAYDPSYAPPYNETNLVHVLGDSCGYYPWIYGLGVSQTSGKVRASECLVTRREAGTFKGYQVYYRLPTSVCRFTVLAGIEGEADTFTDTVPSPSQTFTRMAQNSGQYCGYLVLLRYADSQSGSDLRGQHWVRSA